MLNQNKAEEICRLFEQASSRRGTWESHWKEIADRIYPGASEYFIGEYGTKGNKRNQEVYDSTAAVALSRFAAILDSLLTPRNQTWHRVVPNIDELGKNREARLWFEQVNKLLFKYRYAPSANFSSQNQLNFKSLGAFGSGALYIDELQSLNTQGIRYKNCHLGGVFFMENHQGIIDIVMRKYTLTARQVVQKWGKDKAPDVVMRALEVDPEREFEFIHYVGPRENMDPTRLDFKGMPYESYDVSLEGKLILEEGGYTTFPYATSRYEQSHNEVYGRSPAMDVLPAIKTLNEQKKTLLKQGHRAVDPVLLTHDDGILDTFSLKPGHINAGGVTKDGRPLVHTLPTGNVIAGKDMMQDERELINDNFLITIFQILTDTPAMTATEVMERTREKGILLAPTLGRQQSERLGPQIERELDILSKLGLLPPMPGIVQEAGADFKIEYDSPLSRAQKAEEAAGLMRTIEMTLNYVNVTQNTAPLDHFNMDAIVPDLADINAVPVKWLNSVEDIQKNRQARAEQAQQQQMIDAAPAAAGMAKALK